jgi:hypothetical protein
LRDTSRRWPDTRTRRSIKTSRTLKRAGYSEDAIFELTVSAALGVALEQLDRATTVIRSPGR